MKTYCIKDHLTGHVFKVLLTEEELTEYLEKNEGEFEKVDCVEYDDSPSLLIE